MTELSSDTALSDLGQTLRRVLQSLWIAMKNAALYPPDHPGFLESLKNLTDTLNAILIQRQEISIGFMDAMIYLDGDLAVEESLHHTELIQLFADLGVSALVFVHGIEPREITEFVTILMRESKNRSGTSLDQALDQAKVTHLRIANTSETFLEGIGQAFDTIEKNLVKLLRELCLQISNLHKGMDQFQDSALRQLLNLSSTVVTQAYRHGQEVLRASLCQSLGDPRDTHSVRVMVLATQVGQLAGLSQGRVMDMAIAALLHDLRPNGQKPDKETMKSFLCRLGSLRGLSFTVLGCLLSWEDGCPAPLQPQVFHPFVKILQACDHYDFFTWVPNTARPPRPPRRQLRKMLTNPSFDALCVRLLARVVGYYPVGSLVSLKPADEGGLGLVLSVNDLHPGRPEVARLDRETHQPLQRLDLTELDAESKAFLCSIHRCLDPRRSKIPSQELLEKCLDVL